ncbi:MAG: thioesterase family protein [Sandaracinaceae bacterium]
MNEVELLLPRSAFTPREVARAGDVWRAFQDVAVAGSIQSGWPPARYRDEGVSFIVRSMVVVHERETMYGESLVGTTWPSRFRRGMFFDRECRLRGEAGVVARASQAWVHVGGDLSLRPASEALVSAFPIETHDGPIELPAYVEREKVKGPRFSFDCWYTAMDPLAHVNHPAYVDWADEALARWLVARDLDPVQLVAVAESAQYRMGIVAAERVDVDVEVVGMTEDGAAVFVHEVTCSGDRRAKLVTIRRLHPDPRQAALAAERLFA